jgi:hypothetical protein
MVLEVITKLRSIIVKIFFIFDMWFKLSLVEVIHKSTKCSLDVHLLIHL